MEVGSIQLKSTDKLEVVNMCLIVNGKPFVVEYPDVEAEPIKCIEDGKLVTYFRGCSSMLNYWNPEDIEGYWA